MNTSDPYLLRFLIEADHERRLREADEERLARSIGGGAPRRARWPRLSIQLPRKPAWHLHRPRLNA